MRHLRLLCGLALALPLYSQTPKVDQYFGNVLPSLDAGKVYTSMRFGTADQSKWGSVFPSMRMGVHAYYFSTAFRTAAARPAGYFGLVRDLCYAVYPDVLSNAVTLSMRRSQNGGVSWEQARSIYTPAPGETIQDVRLLTAGADYVFVLVLVVNSRGSRLELRASKDRGKSFVGLPVSIKVATVVPIHLDACASSDGTLHVAYTATEPSPKTFNAYYSRIAFRGNNLTRSVDTLYQGLSGELNSKPGTWTRVACDGPHVCYSWISQRSATDFRAYIRYSSDGGRNWGNALAVGRSEDGVDAGARLFCTVDNTASKAKPLAWLIRLDARSGVGKLFLTKADMATAKIEKTEDVTQGTSTTDVITWDAMVSEFQPKVGANETAAAVVAWSEPNANTQLSADSANNMLAKKHAFTSVSGSPSDLFFAITGISLDARLILEDRRSLAYALLSSGGLRKVVGTYRDTGNTLVNYTDARPGDQIGKAGLFLLSTCSVSRNGDIVGMWLEDAGSQPPRIAGCSTHSLVVEDNTKTPSGELVFRGAPPGTTLLILPNIQKLIPPSPVRIPGLANFRMQWDGFTNLMLVNFSNTIVLQADIRGVARAKVGDLSKRFPKVTLAIETLGFARGRYWRQNLVGPLPRR